MQSHRIMILAPGSRGDIQPYLALGSLLKARGHSVVLVSNAIYADLVAPFGLDFHPLDLDVRGLVQDGTTLASLAVRGGEMRATFGAMAQACLEASRGSTLLIGGITGVLIAASVAERLALPLLQAYNVPLSPTRAFAGALLPGMPRGPWGIGYGLSNRLTRQAIWQAYRLVDRTVRVETLGLRPFPAAGPWDKGLLGSSTVLYGISPSVLPQPPDWDPARIQVTGYWFLDEAPGWEVPQDLEEFLAAGSPPVYVGFGSMSSQEPEATAALVFKALERSGQRGIVYAGWNGLKARDMPSSVHMVEALPHSWLFPRMAAVIHHGGAGTTAAGFRSGRPSIIVPFHGDQPFWARKAAGLGVAPSPLPRRSLSAEGLAKAIDRALGDTGIIAAARELGERIAGEDGLGRAVDHIEAL